MKQALALALALGLAGCSTASPDIPAPPAEWLQLAEPLPPVPSCDHHADRAAHIACRLAYDEPVRGQCVAVAERHAALAAWSQRVSKPQ